MAGANPTDYKPVIDAHKRKAKVPAASPLEYPMAEPDADIEWREVKFTERNQGWTEYELETGELVRMRSLVAKIELGYDPGSGEKIILDNGEPLVRIKASNFLEVNEVD